MPAPIRAELLTATSASTDDAGPIAAVPIVVAEEIFSRTFESDRCSIVGLAIIVSITRDL
jgi:hypothetical protein